MDDFVVGAIPATAVDLIWDKVEPLIKMVEDKSPTDINTDVVKERLIGGYQLLVTISRGTEVIAVNVLDAKTLDTGIRVLYIPITAGSELEVWIDRFLEVAIAIAKDYNCVELRGLAVRNGWLRKLKPYGWEEMFTTIRYEIGE